MRPTAARAFTSTSLPTPPTAAAESGTEVPPWHSPVPAYLLGGLAAMMGLIAVALALLILACACIDTVRRPSSRAGATGDGGGKSPPGTAELVAVVMAGDRAPSFLAAPTGRRAASLDAGGGGGERPVAEENSGRKAGEESSAVAAQAQPEPGGDQNLGLGV